MAPAPIATVDPFRSAVRGITEQNPAHAALRAAGPLVRVAAPGGGPAWVVTEDALARAVLADPRIVKDPAFAPESWDARAVDLEPTAAQQLSLTTHDGEGHARLRRAHTPLLAARRLLDRSDRIAAIVRELLGSPDLPAGADERDLVADLTTRLPLAVIADLLGLAPAAVDPFVAACQGMYTSDPVAQGRAFGAYTALAAQAMAGEFAAGLRERYDGDLTDEQLQYQLFALILAGHLTTDAALGFVLAHLLDPEPRPETSGTADELVREVLRRHPPAPFSLWRFTATGIELAGEALPPRSPVLVDILGINTDPDRPAGPDLSFGAGPHYCVGAQLAQLELRVVVEVIRTDHPGARLAVPFESLQQIDSPGIQGARLASLPVTGLR